MPISLSPLTPSLSAVPKKFWLLHLIKPHYCRPVVFKLKWVSESLGKSIKTNFTGVHPRVSDSVENLNFSR